VNKKPFEFDCKNHEWSNHRYDRTCLMCGVSCWKNRDTGELEPGGFRGTRPLQCLKASDPFHPMCQLSVRSFNSLMNHEMTNKDEIRSLLDSGKFPYIRNLGGKSLTEIATWCGATTSPKTLHNMYLKNYVTLHAEWVLNRGIIQ
jgi:hypothetical protein